MKTQRSTFGMIWSYPLLSGLVLLLALSPVAATVARPDFNRYEVILSRRPFGEPPPVVEPPGGQNKPTEPPPAFAAKLKMVAITEKSGTIRVGFVDGGDKPARTYFLFVGDSENGYEVLRADYEAESAVIKKDGHEIALTMGGGGGTLASSANTTAPQLASTSRARRASSTSRTRPSQSTLTREQYLAEQEAGLRGTPTSPRQALRQNEGAPDMADMPPEMRELAMRKYNLELIRAQGEKGLPLPIPLTIEEDNMLVEEGVLPPAE